MPFLSLFSLPTRRCLFGAAILGAAAVVPLAPANAEYNLRLTTFVPEGTSTYEDYVQVFIDNVELLTGGEVKIQGFGAGVLAGPFEGWQAVQQGVADVMFGFSAFLSNQDPANAILSGLPAGMPLDAKMHWLLAGGGEELWVEFRRDTMGLHPVVAGFGPTEIFMHSNRAVRTAEDLDGLKFRTAGAWADIIQEYGASPVVLPPSDIFTALERGVIDGTEFVTPSGNQRLGYQDIAKYIITPGIHVPSFAYEAVFNAETWDSFPEEIQKQIIAAGHLTAVQGNLRTGIADLDAMAELRQGDNEWIELEPEFMEAIAKSARAWAEAKAEEQTAAGNPWMRRMVDSYYTFFDKWNSSADYRMNEVPQ